jgi:hypothetical protein
MLALCPNTDKGILVIMEVAFISIMTGWDVETLVSSYDGAVNVLGVQPSRKNPMVLAVLGSTPGVIESVFVVAGVAGSFPLLWQE